MTDLNQAVEAARAFLTKAVPDPKEVHMEEVDLSDDDDVVDHVELCPSGEESSSRPFEPLRLALGQEPGVARFERVYRRIAIVDGEGRSMTIREFATA